MRVSRPWFAVGAAMDRFIHSIKWYKCDAAQAVLIFALEREFKPVLEADLGVS